MGSSSDNSLQSPGPSTLKPPKLDLRQEDANQEVIFDATDPKIKSSTPLKHRPPSPITTDNVDESAQLLKRQQDLTGQKLVGRNMGKSLRVYTPQTPLAYKQIRKLIDDEKLEAFTHQLSEDKELKIVIRGMPVKIPIQEITEEPA
ncbi:hypothetical protein TNCT_656501 [Trichonephila clavata]|uniref:Uncharacterized protein n=1 Tax=Trichonephila clavata TaxID=2740835 RepID=A0A8X6JEG9_TRICU|nr:hypothetical protein TNCT_656501 [Trichonephila clavata]